MAAVSGECSGGESCLFPVFTQPHMPLVSSCLLGSFGWTRGELCLDGLALGGPVWKVTRLQ